MIALFAKHLLLLVAVFVAFFGLGRGLFQLVFPNIKLWDKPSQVFASVILGTVVTAIGYAVVKTGGITILWGLVPILALLWYQAKKLLLADVSVSPAHQGGWGTTLAYLTIVGLLCFSFFFGKVYVSNFPTSFITPHGNDYAFYANLSQGLGLSGLENNQIPQTHLEGQPQTTRPYHYFDFWLTDFLAKGLDQLHLVAYFLYVLPLFLLTSCLGLWVLGRKYGLGLWALPFSILFLGIGSLHLNAYNSITYLSKEHYQMHHLGGMVLNFYKLVHLVPFLLASLVFLAFNRYALALITLASIPILYGSFIPAILGVTIFLALLNLKWKYVKDTDAILGFGAIILIVAFYGGFYLLFGDTAGVNPKGGLELFSIAALKTRINIMGLTTLQTGVVYFPLVVILGVLYILNRKLFAPVRKQQAIQIVYFLSIFAFGLGAWGILYKSNDAIQIFSNAFILANFVLATFTISILGTIVVHKTYKWYNMVLGGALALILTWHIFSNTTSGLSSKLEIAGIYSPEYISAINSQFVGEKHAMGVYLKGADEYNHKKYKPAHRNSLAFSSAWYLATMPQYYSTLHLSALDFEFSDDPLERSREMVSRSRNLFGIYVEQQKADGTFVSLDASKLAFAKQYKIKYLIATPSAVIPESFASIIKECFVDNKTGERFCTLNIQ